MFGGFANDEKDCQCRMRRAHAVDTNVKALDALATVLEGLDCVWSKGFGLLLRENATEIGSFGAADFASPRVKPTNRFA
jgi:hypothetical protein